MEYSVEEIQATMRHLGFKPSSFTLQIVVQVVRQHRPANLYEWLKNMYGYRSPVKVVS